jgi:hypothetical protein
VAAATGLVVTVEETKGFVEVTTGMVEVETTGNVEVELKTTTGTTELATEKVGVGVEVEVETTGGVEVELGSRTGFGAASNGRSATGPGVRFGTRAGACVVATKNVCAALAKGTFNDTESPGTRLCGVSFDRSLLSMSSSTFPDSSGSSACWPYPFPCSSGLRFPVSSGALRSTDS